MVGKQSFSVAEKLKGNGKADAEEVRPEDPNKAEWPDEDLGACASIAKDKWVTALTIQNATKPWESFQYRHIAVRSTFEATRFEVFFVGDNEKWRIIVTGRNLRRIYNLLIQHRLEWIREGDHDVDDEKKGYVKSVVADLVEEKK